MQSRRLRLSQVFLLVLLGACAPARPHAPNLQSTPSGGGSWTITLRQSGGFVGVDLTVQVTSEGELEAADQHSGRHATLQLPPKSIADLDQMYSEAISPGQTLQGSACADCFLYDLEIMSQDGSAHIRLDDTTLADSKAEPLIRYLIQRRDAALATP